MQDMKAVANFFLAHNNARLDFQADPTNPVVHWRNTSISRTLQPNVPGGPPLQWVEMALNNNGIAGVGDVGTTESAVQHRAANGGLAICNNTTLNDIHNG